MIYLICFSVCGEVNTRLELSVLVCYCLFNRNLNSYRGNSRYSKSHSKWHSLFQLNAKAVSFVWHLPNWHKLNKLKSSSIRELSNSIAALSNSTKEFSNSINELSNWIREHSNWIAELSKPDTGVYKRDWWGRANYLCSHCFLWPGTIKSWWKPSPGQTDQLHTLQHSPHTCIHKWREGIKRVMHSAPKKIVEAMRHVQRRTAWYNLQLRIAGQWVLRM